MKKILKILSLRAIPKQSCIFVFALFLIFLSPAITYLYAAWQIQTLDSAGTVGLYPSIALDGSGNPHISYSDGTNNDLKYAKWTGSSWSIQTVDSAGNVVGYTSIVLDGSGNPHISYYEWTNYDLKYAKWTGSSWSIQTVDSAGWAGYETSIALDGSGNPHISYYDMLNSDLKYAKWTGTSWSIQTVDSAGYVGSRNSIDIDGSGNPHISYHDSTNDDLKYAKWNGSFWSIQTVDSAGSVGENNSIALDGSGNPHISYFDNTNDDLKYAKWTGSSWSIQTIDSAGSVGLYPSIALDGSGNPHISYFDWINLDLKYAKWTGSSWSIQTVDSAGAVGEYTSIALDGLGNPHISYYDSTNKDLKYAKLTGNNAPTLSWTGETNYTSDGLHPEVGYSTDTFTYRVQYTDADNDAPASGYPKIHIKKGGVEISGSPFTMTGVDAGDTNYTDGKFYTYSRMLSSGTDYTYYFEAQDSNGANATGTPTTPIDAPDVTLANNAPTLSWTGETNYVSDGLNPEAGNTSTTFIYRVKYTDTDNNAPASGYPKVHIKKGGAGISGSPFTMTYVSGNYNTGAIYTYSRTLSLGTDYTYYFEAQDSNGANATGTPTIPIDAPDVTQFSGGYWQIQTVDSSGDVGHDPSLALDGSGNPHISYWDETNHKIKYAKWTGSSWQIQTVDSAGGETSLALDGSGNPHISYRSLGDDIKYAKWSGPSWSIQTVDSTGGETSLALDSSGNPHISYIDWTNYDLKYAKWTGSSWSIQTVDFAGNVGYQTSIDIDASGNPHISYYDSSNGDLKYAKWTGTSWSIQTVDFAGNVGYKTSIDIDGFGNPHISYRDETNHKLKYAKWTGHSWLIQTVDSARWSTSIALDGSGNPHISYSDLTNYDLKYAKWTGSYWSIQTVDSAGDVGWYTSIALDGSGNPHISYYDGTNYDLKYAKWVPSGVPSGTLSGKVTKSDGTTGIPGATVEILGDGSLINQATTDSSGNYSITVVTGTYNVRASASGYQTLTKTGILIISGQTTTVNFTLLSTEQEKPQKEYKTTIGDNLFNPKTGGTAKVKFNVPSSGKVSLKIYDLSGKLIRNLFESDVSAGNFQKDWDGKDDSGRYVVPGVYFLHYVYPGGKETRKIGVKK